MTVSELGAEQPTAEQASEPSFNGLMLDALDRHGASTCFRVWRRGRYRDISYRHFRRQTLRFTHFLSQRPLRGERIALWAGNSPEWMVVHLATLFAGAVSVPCRRSLPPQAIEHILADCGARVLVLEDQEQMAWLGEIRDRLTELELVVVLETQAAGSSRLGGVANDRQKLSEEVGGEVRFLTDLVAERLEPPMVEELISHAVDLPAETLAVIHYSATQTGMPIGAVFDHRGRRASLQNIRRWSSFVVDDLAFTVLPWAGAASLDAGLCYLGSGIPNVLSHGQELVFEEIQQASPTLVLTIPNALERAYDEIIGKSVRDLPESTQEMFYWALATGKQLLQAGSEASAELRDRHARADRTFFSAIRGAFGGRFRRFFCTGAPLQRGLAESVQAVGLTPINAYSLTEAGGFPAVNLPVGRHPEACGSPAPGFEVRISGRGEVEVRGPSMMREYWRDPEATDQAFTADGWLRTGDLGHFDEDGLLHLTGRLGDTLLLSTGRRVAPGHLEAMLERSPYVHRAAVVGDGRPYVVALIVPAVDAIVAELTGREGLPEDLEASDLRAPGASKLRWSLRSDDEDQETLVTTAHPEAAALLDAVIAEVDAQVDQWERIGGYSLVGDPTSPEGRRLEDMLAHDRGLIAQHFGDSISNLYPRGLRPSDREITQVKVGPERLRELLEKETILDAWTSDAGIEFLFDLAREHGIETPSVVHICDAAAAVSQMEAEEKPLSTALVVGDPMRIHRVLGSSLIQLHRHEHIRRMRGRVVDLAKLVDGAVHAFAIDRHGYMRGVCRLRLDLEEAPRAFFGPQFRLHAEVSRLCDAVVFFVPKGGRQVRVFARGELVGRYSNGDWTPEDAGLLDRTVNQLAADHQMDQDLLERLVRCAFRMSEENLGAIFMVGEAERILEKSDAAELRHFAWISSAPVETLTDDELIDFAKQDGATVIDAATGRFRSCMVLLRPDATTRAEIGPGKGARHSSAAKMSAEASALAITVSQDGPITLYDRGRRVLAI